MTYHIHGEKQGALACLDLTPILCDPEVFEWSRDSRFNYPLQSAFRQENYKTNCFSQK